MNSSLFSPFSRFFESYQNDADIMSSFLYLCLNFSKSGELSAQPRLQTTASTSC